MNERIENKTKEMLALVKLKNPNLLQNIAKKTNTTALGTTLMLSRMNRTTTRWWFIFLLSYQSLFINKKES